MLGEIDQALLYRLTPEILKLQYASREPITVYIDSPGGSTQVADDLLRLLLSSDQDLAAPCRLITVVTGLAASAAADLLSAGDYSIALPRASILFHGVRYLEAELTHEKASLLANSLKQSNDSYAVSLSQRCIERHLFQYLIAKSDNFEQIREQANIQEGNDFICFITYLSQRLSSASLPIFNEAVERYLRYQKLWHQLAGALTNLSGTSEDPSRLAEIEALAIKQIVNFELSKHKEAYWTFRDSGMFDLQNDFYLLAEFIQPRHRQQIEKVGERFQDVLLSQEDQVELAKFSGEEANEKKRTKLKMAVEPLWFFFFALCLTLQNGENMMSTLDAYYLGLIDEVLGEPLPSPRLLIEHTTF